MLRRLPISAKLSPLARGPQGAQHAAHDRGGDGRAAARKQTDAAHDVFAAAFEEVARSARLNGAHHDGVFGVGRVDDDLEFGILLNRLGENRRDVLVGEDHVGDEKAEIGMLGEELFELRGRHGRRKDGKVVVTVDLTCYACGLGSVVGGNQYSDDFLVGGSHCGSSNSFGGIFVGMKL